MATVHKQTGKPNYFCAFYDPEGFRRFRTTGTENKKIAVTICVNIARASTLARQGKLSNEKALKLIRETCNAIAETHGKLAGDQAHNILKASIEEFIKIAGGEFTSYTIKSWLESWVDGRTDASKATITQYHSSIKSFLAFLGARASRPLTTLQPRQIEEFKTHLITRVSPSSVNKAIKILKASLNNAVAKRQLEFSPAEHVTSLEEAEGNRREFTLAELTKLLKSKESEWVTMVMLGYYTGLRLRDCANLTWEKVQLHNGIINVKTQKTGRVQDLPIAEPLKLHLEKIAGDDPAAPLCPSLHGKAPSWLSAQFYDVMEKAGLVVKRDHQSKGKGRDARREKNRISFHSLRYNTTSALKSTGASDSVAMDIVGHDTASVSRNYTNIDEATKRAAINKLPDITK